MECQIGVVLPTPALVAGTLAVLEPEHVDLTESASTAESGKVGDSHNCSAGRDESFVRRSGQSLSTAHVRPSSMRQDSATGHGSHMRVVEAMIPTKCHKVAHGCDCSSIRIDESLMRLYELALPHAIHMRPALV